jgi:PTH1 family peptidyl-tRNA hydrolase
MRLVVGLGNPGSEYAHNRHNIGFMALDAVMRRHDFAAPHRKFHGAVAEGRIAGERVLALKPLTYMNESGVSVAEASRFYKIPSEHIYVLYDELDLVPGKVRVKRGGGSAGHNGIRSIDAHCEPDYWRIRLGIGHPGDRSTVLHYVLRDFTKADLVWLRPLLDAVAETIPLLLEGRDSDFVSHVALRMRPPKPERAEGPRAKTSDPSD